MKTTNSDTSKLLNGFHYYEIHDEKNPNDATITYRGNSSFKNLSDATSAVTEISSVLPYMDFVIVEVTTSRRVWEVVEK